MQQPVRVVTKDLKEKPAKKEIESYTIGEEPMDPDRLEFLARVFEVAGKQDVTAFRAAIATGDKPTYGGALVDALNEFIFPGAAAPAPAAPARPMPVKMNSEELKRQVKKASQDPYYQIAAGLTKGWPGPDAA
jgi:hypothetical protein